MSILIWDTETETDRARIMRIERPVLAPGESVDVGVKRVLDAACEDRARTDKPCFTPVRFQAPTTIVMLLVNDDLSYLNHMVIANRDHSGRPDYKANAESFWNAYNYAHDNFGRPLLVDFNGLHFDCPLMEVCGIEHGCDLSRWFALGAKAWEDPRSSIATTVHLDLFNFLASRGQVGGNLSFWSRLVDLPGKLDITGEDVAKLLQTPEGHQRVADYCITDVLNTYGLLFHLLYCMRRVPTSFRCPTFEATMAKMAEGRGRDVQAFIDAYNAPF